MSTTTEGLKADTYGWDTVFAIRIDDVNASIARAKSSPTVFSASTKDPHTQIEVDINGNFGDWEITLGGSGKLIHMKTPVTSLVAKGKKPDGTPITFAYGAGSFEIEVELEYIPQETPPPNSTGIFHDLKVKHTGATADEQVVTVLGAYNFGNSTDGSNTPFDAVSDDVCTAMQTWFNANLIDFTHVFTTVNLNRDADKGQFKWLLPTTTSYAYIDGGTTDDSVLGVLCMTDNRSADGLVQEVSPNAIPSGSRAGFLIAPERFIEEMLLPSMPLVYKGATSSDFKLRTDETGLILSKGAVTIDSLKDDDGKSYKTELKNFELSTTNQALSIDATTKVEVSPGIHAYSHNMASFGLTLHTLPDGTETIYYVAVGKPVIEHWTEESEGVKITKILEGIAAALITVAIGVLTDGAGFAIAAVVMGTLAGVASKVPDIIAAANTDASPSVSLLTFNAVDPIQWTDQKDFNLDQVSLNYAVQMGGTISIGSSD
jgi:hypothetical protein